MVRGGGGGGGGGGRIQCQSACYFVYHNESLPTSRGGLTNLAGFISSEEGKKRT